ncbi:MAG: hypothetical protein WCW78_01050 [Candidatus Paceibacterota bacterium]|jgi:hypothetical protein
MSTRAVVATTLFVVLFVIIAGGELLKNTVKSANTSKTSQKVESTNYSGLREELTKVQKGDFIQFGGEWYSVVAINEKLGLITAYPNGYSSCEINYNLDPIAAKIGLVIRWNEGIESGINPPVGHIKWTTVAREFFGVQ